MAGSHARIKFFRQGHEFGRVPVRAVWAAAPGLRLGVSCAIRPQGGPGQNGMASTSRLGSARSSELPGRWHG